MDFQQIYDAYHSKVFRYMSRLVDEAEAEDLTQEVFVKAHRALNAFRGDAKLSTWLYRIATNTALDRLRSPSFKQIAASSSSRELDEKVDTEINEKAADIEETKPLVEWQLVQKQMNECIRGYIERLPVSYRSVLVLSEWEGLRNDEIADILEITLSTVKIRLHRAKEKIKEALLANCDPNWIEENEFLPDLKKYL